jgi:ssDNA-binding replication factor A large subunit
MINMPYEVIIERIKEKSGLSDSEITQKIDQKLNQLSGLISKEGAAHILANELGIKIFEVPKNLKIKEILDGMRSIDISGKVQQIYEVREFKTEKGSGKVGSFILADETGSIRVVCWYDQTEIINKLVKDVIVKVAGGYVRNNNNRKEIHINERSKVIINPKGISIGEVKAFTSTRKKLSELVENENNVEVFATIVQVFEPRFFEICPECSKRAKPREDGFFCEEHQKVSPDYSYVVNLLLDDGTETTRTIFFARQLETLIKKKKDEILKYKENLSDFEQIKTDLLGKTIKVIGRVRKNEMFARLEIISQLVFPDIDPDEEIKRLAAEQKTETTQETTQEPTQETTQEPTQETTQEPTQETTQETTQEPTSEQSTNTDNAL